MMSSIPFMSSSMANRKNPSVHFLSHWRNKNTPLCAANMQRCILLVYFGWRTLSQDSAKVRKPLYRIELKCLDHEQMGMFRKQRNPLKKCMSGSKATRICFFKDAHSPKKHCHSRHREQILQNSSTMDDDKWGALYPWHNIPRHLPL